MGRKYLLFCVLAALLLYIAMNIFIPFLDKGYNWVIQNDLIISQQLQTIKKATPERSGLNVSFNIYLLFEQVDAAEHFSSFLSDGY